MRLPILLCAAVLLAGCASYDGRGLVPGKSTSGDVQALMGSPAERLASADGGSVWYYPRNPAGLHTYAVRIGPDGVMRGIEQRLTVENMGKLVAGTTTAKQVRELLGPPWRVTRLERQRRDVWEYSMYDAVQDEHFLYVQFSGDGLVREVLLLRDLRKEQGDATSRP
ncbi:MAG: hypothetical protein AB1452_01150 [Pseudomonadota bacterium]